MIYGLELKIHMIVIYDIILFKSYTNMEKMQIRAYTIGINMQISINIFCNSFSRIKVVNDTIWKQSQNYTADDYKTDGNQIRTVTGIKTSGWPIENLVNIQLRLVIGGENLWPADLFIKLANKVWESRQEFPSYLHQWEIM